MANAPHRERSERYAVPTTRVEAPVSNPASYTDMQTLYQNRDFDKLSLRSFAISAYGLSQSPVRMHRVGDTCFTEATGGSVCLLAPLSGAFGIVALLMT